MFKWIKGYKNKYKINDAGEVESVDRFQNGRFKNKKSILRGRFLKYSITKGYPTVVLCKNARTKRFTVHRLLYVTFIGKIPHNKQINHIDGNPKNCHLSNLEILTPKENTQHAWRTGLCRIYRGEENVHSKLTEKQVIEIKRLAATKKTQKEIALMFKCHQANIHYILSNKTWKHVKA